MLEGRPIVVVEDDLDDQFIIETLVKELGVQNPLIFLTDGFQGLEYLKNMPTAAALILSDINMPKLNGLELKAEINKDFHLSKKCVPFFFMTTTISQETAAQAYALGIQGFFVKKGSMDEMKEMLEHVIQISKFGIYPKDFPKTNQVQ